MGEPFYGRALFWGGIIVPRLLLSTEGLLPWEAGYCE